MNRSNPPSVVSSSSLHCKPPGAKRLWRWAVFGLACLATPLHAQTIAFDNGAGTGLWSTATNWASDVLPGSANTANLAGLNTTVNSTFSIAGISNTVTNGQLNIASGANVTVGASNINTGSIDLTINVTGGALTFQRLFTNSGLANSTGQIWMSGGTVTVTNRITLTNTQTTSTEINGFSMSGGTLNLSAATSGFTLFGADVDDRPFFEFTGLSGLFGSAAGRCAVTLANTASGTPSATAASVKFTLTGTSVTTVYATNLTLASNPISIDFSQLSLSPGIYTYTLFDYNGTLTGALATPTFIGLGSNSASLVYDTTGKKIQLSYTVNSVSTITATDFNLPAQDANGWTILTTSTDTRLIYIDPVNGSDVSGTYYAPSAPNIGSNPQMPVGAVAAFKTIAKATSGYVAMRDNKPDWLLLKAGNVFTESLNFRYGRSPSERAVVCSYGTGARPELRTGASYGILPTNGANLIISGIKFWAHTRDTEGPYFVTGTTVNRGFMFNVMPFGDPRVVRDILIEDCLFRSYFSNELNGSISSGTCPPITRFALRRSIISGNYISGDTHAQGLWHTGGGQPVQPSVLVQESTFDHNGWLIQSTGTGGANGMATMFNHNTYFCDANGVVFEGNHFLRASSIGNKWTSTTATIAGTATSTSVLIANNLYAEGELGIALGGNYVGAYRTKNVVVTDNVMTDLGRTHPTNRSLAWYLDMSDSKSFDVVDNLFIHQRDLTISNAFGIRFSTVGVPGGTDDVLVAGNVIADMRGSTGYSSAMVRLENGSITTNVTFQDNIVQSPTATPLARFTTGGYSFAGTNQYWSTAASNSFFALNSSLTDLAGWKTGTADNGAITAAPSFPDSTRDVEHYIQSLGLGTTFQDFITALNNQSKANWNPNLTAKKVNNWLRAGFGMAPVN